MLIEQVNTLAALTLNSPYKVITTSFVISEEACGFQALIFDTVYGSLILFPLLFTFGNTNIIYQVKLLLAILRKMITIPKYFVNLVKS